MQTDVMVSGGGLAGMAAAAAFGRAGFSVICVDPAEAGEVHDDPRTTAILRSSVPLLEAAGLWERILPYAAPLQTMQIIDAGGDPPTPNVRRSFDAAEISDQPFGWNLPNSILRREMVACVAQEGSGVTYMPGCATTRVVNRDREALVRLSSGAALRARLVIAADGRHSPLRRQMNIDIKTLRYGQKALVLHVSHPMPHNHISTEIHLSGGPFTLVPLPDTAEGAHNSAIVWMDRAAEIDRLVALSSDDFLVAINRRACGVLGALQPITEPKTWPIMSQYATHLVAGRVALVAEAAHALPPIGAQGLNMSLADIQALLDLAQGRPDSLGDTAMMRSYHQKRHPVIKARLRGVDFLNRSSMASSPPLQALRAAGLKGLHGAKPVRHALMKLGLAGMRG